jgi:hypothetical protein
MIPALAVALITALAASPAPIATQDHFAREFVAAADGEACRHGSCRLRTM